MPVFITSKEKVTNTLNSTSSEIIYELIGRIPTHGGVHNHSLAYIVIKPGCASRTHFHLKTEETYYLLSGSARLVVDGESYEMAPGQACLLLPGQRHQIINQGEDDLVFLAVCTPAWHPEDSHYID